MFYIYISIVYIDLHYISIEMYSSTTSSHPLSEAMRLRGRLAAGGSTALLLQALPTWLDGESTGKWIHENCGLMVIFKGKTIGKWWFFMGFNGI